MKIIKRMVVSEDLWAKYKATRQLVSTKGNIDIFGGNSDNLVGFVGVGQQEMMMIVVSVDSSMAEDIFRGYAEDYLDDVVGIIRNL